MPPAPRTRTTWKRRVPVNSGRTDEAVGLLRMRSPERGALASRGSLGDPDQTVGSKRRRPMLGGGSVGGPLVTGASGVGASSTSPSPLCS
jgi:hypothetical protein